MTIFRNKDNKKLYTIEHLLVDIKFANCGGHCGFYAYPFGHSGDIIKSTKDKPDANHNNFVESKFIPVAYK